MVVQESQDARPPRCLLSWQRGREPSAASGQLPLACGCLACPPGTGSPCPCLPGLEGGEGGAAQGSNARSGARVSGHLVLEEQEAALWPVPPPLGTASASGPRVGAGVQALRGLPPAQPGLLPSLSDPVVISACWASAEACGVQVTAWACVPGEGAQDPAVLPEGLLWGPPGLGQRLETPAPSTCPAFRGFGAASAWVVESWAGALWPRGEPGRGGQPRLWPSALPAPGSHF